MQFPHTPQQTQLPLFEAFLAQPMDADPQRSGRAPVDMPNLKYSVSCHCEVRPGTA
jgi:hypothetical protein